MKSFKFSYSLKGRLTLVSTYITGDGRNLDEAYIDALDKVNKKHSSHIDSYQLQNGGNCINMHKASGHEVNYFFA